MACRLADWKWAFLAALGLTGAAALILFLIRPGFESQIGWFFALMPGAIAGAPISERAYRTLPWSAPTVLWRLTLGISILWYFAISFGVIKFWRLALAVWRHRGQ
jgi:hypothetical protein